MNSFVVKIDIPNSSYKPSNLVTCVCVFSAQAKFASVLEEFSVRDKLTEMDKLWDENDHNEAAW